MHLLPIFPALTQLTLAFRHPLAGDFGLPAMLHLACTFPLLKRLQITTEAEYNLTGPFNLPERTTLEPLAHLHTVHLNYPILNTRVLASYAAYPGVVLSARHPARHAHWAPHDAASAHGAPCSTLCAPVPRHILVATAAHLLERVLTTPRLEELGIEIERIDREDEVATKDRDEGRASLSYMRLGPSVFADRTGDKPPWPPPL
ncbi:hypothetical protein B0H13DRAFT_2426382 [Mycena leptocephala]|nr:hypothetical protein B0H13DRAFT_2426382 [Mycena leptocephala]